MNKQNKMTGNETVNPLVAGNWYQNLHHQKTDNLEPIERSKMKVFDCAKDIKDMFGSEVSNVLIDGIMHYVDNMFNLLEESSEFGTVVLDATTRTEILNGIYTRSEAAKMISKLIYPVSLIETYESRVELAERGVKL